MTFRFYSLSLLCITVFFPFLAEAQLIKHKVTPRVIDHDVEQRDILTEEISIQNLAAHKITVYPSINEVVVDEGGDIIDFSPPSMSDNRVTVTSWLEISRGGIELPNGASTTIPLTIKIHPQAEPGVYHAFVGFGSGRNRDIAETQIKDGIAPGVVVTLAVEQDSVSALKLNSFIVERFVTAPDGESVMYTLTNPGSADVQPTGEIILSNNRGEEVGSITVNPEASTLAPGESKAYVAGIETAGLLGKYKAFLTVDYGDSQLASVYDTAFFYVIPWKQLLVLFGILCFVAILVTIIIHRRYGKDDDDDDEHGAAYIPLFIRNHLSDEQQHDINLKNS